VVQGAPRHPLPRAAAAARTRPGAGHRRSRRREHQGLAGPWLAGTRPGVLGLGRRRGQSGISAIRADARYLPLDSATCDLVTAFDILEHIDEDYLAAAEIARVLKPGGTALIAVPCDMALWSAHDDEVGHVRRYTRPELVNVISKAGLTVDDVWSWNVLLRPVVAFRRKSSTGSDLDEVPPLVNAALTSIIVAERYLPTKSLPGVSLFLRARR
jgi:SAM-dependent methyltransferase